MDWGTLRRPVGSLDARGTALVLKRTFSADQAVGEPRRRAKKAETGRKLNRRRVGNFISSKGTSSKVEDKRNGARGSLSNNLILDGGLIKIFCKAEVEQIFGVIVEQVIGEALLVLGEELDLEGVGEEVIDLGDAGPSVIVTGIGVGEGREAGEGDAGAWACLDLDIGTGAVLDAGEGSADEIDDIIARDEAIEDDFGADDLADIVADDLVSLVLESADGATEVEAFLGVGACLVGEEDTPEEGILVGIKVGSEFGVELELVGDGAIDSEANGLTETSFEIGAEGAIDGERFEAKIFAFGDEDDAELVAEAWEAATALIIPEIFVGGDDAETGIAEDFAIGLGADGVAVVEDIGGGLLVDLELALGDVAVTWSKGVTSCGIGTGEAAVAKDEGVVAVIIFEASDIDDEIIGEEDIPSAEIGVPSDFGTEAGVLT